MIPRVIELKNFLSYGDAIQTIDFKDYDLICLSGKNGHGKSALLDALTWALWGQARKIIGAAKADEGLLRLGQTRMMVCAEFEFGQQLYRVRREFAKTYGKPYSALDFEIFSTTRQSYTSLTDKTIRITQEKIESLLGLDYDTFINTSFLRQGQANEFSKKNPKERKQILASILGLSKYDLLQQQVQEISKRHIDEKKILSTLIEQSNRPLEQEDFLKNQSKQIKLTTESINEKIQTLSNALGLEEKEQTQLANLKNQVSLLYQEKQVINQKYQQKIIILKSLLMEWKKVHKAAILLPNIKDLEEQKRLLLKQEQHFLEMRKKMLTLQEHELLLRTQRQHRQVLLKTELDKNTYLKRIELEKLTIHITQQTTIATQKKNILQELAKKHTDITTDLADIQKKQRAMESFVSAYQTNKKQFEKRRATYQSLVQKGNWLKNTLHDAEQKKRLVDDLSNPACPLCEQMLTVKRKHFLGAKLITHEHFLHHQMTRVSTLLKKLKTILLEQHSLLEQQEKENDFFKLRGEQERLLITTLSEITLACENLVAEIIEIQNQLEQSKISIKNHTHALEQMEKDGLIIIDNDNEIQQITQQLTLIEQEKTLCVYDQSSYAAIQTTINHIDQTINEIMRVQSDREKQVVRYTQIHHIALELKEQKKNISHLEKTILDIETKLIKESFVIQSINEINKQIDSFMLQKKEITQQQLRLDAELLHIEKTKLDQKTHKEQVVKLDQEIDDHQILIQALSKNGIQALLIEEAIPEIEHEANALLAKLTDNQAQIFIESLRDLKNGGVKESLDIHISDATGIRPYEMYSGGEAFRVDFALRIAISKLLARRSGTALQTLIIDEGFGSQDEEGLARITEALYSIKNDFSKIIVVSHLSEMKDSFPVHFIVEKHPSGSTVKIEERG
jgi:exonuclease SbcC